MNFTTDHPNQLIFGTPAMRSLVVCMYVWPVVFSGLHTIYKAIMAWSFCYCGGGVAFRLGNMLSSGENMSVV